ncbi:MAG: hypothetical protein AAFQ40_09685 [Cyanobacteria bacterium J06623_5]
MYFSEQPANRRQPGYFRVSTLALLAFATLFFSRTLDALGAPSLINFAHFLFVPLASGLIIIESKVRDRKQILSAYALLSLLCLFFIVHLVSALANDAGIINVILNFLLLTEPFIMLLALVSIPLSIKRIKQLKNWVALFAFYNLFLAYFQRYVLGTANPDFLYGAFFSVAGATVSAIVSLVFSVYYLISEKTQPLWVRSLILVAALWQIIISDTKLVLGSFLIGFILFSFSKINTRTIIYIILSLFLCLFFFWAMENIEFFNAYAIWIKPELFTNFDSEFYRAKLMTFSIVPQYYDSFMDHLFGLGPGHGVGRLGGWMLEKYSHLLTPVGATHPYPSMRADIMTAAATESRNVIGTAMYGPVFSWAGIWSDLGIVGLSSYLLIWIFIWQRYCPHDFSKYIVAATLTTGLFPGYLEEPSSMLFTTFVIGLWWHEQKSISKAASSQPPTSTVLPSRPLSNTQSGRTSSE